ncbi:MAG: hypothetical protein U5L03_16210 [Burkholderiaceae bacterium]|nr:hypothetical protein [Burkholderiaceae bacterium]
MTFAKPVVTLGVDVGGKDAHAATSEVCMELRRALARECQGPYGQSFEEFALVVRIDGSVQSWEKSGVDNVRLQRKSKHATADVFVPQGVWAAGPGPFRSFLAENIVAAIETIIDRAKKAKDQIDSEHLIADVRRATKH